MILIIIFDGHNSYHCSKYLVIHVSKHKTTKVFIFEENIFVILYSTAESFKFMVWCYET